MFLVIRFLIIKIYLVIFLFKWNMYFFKMGLFILRLYVFYMVSVDVVNYILKRRID